MLAGFLIADNISVDFVPEKYGPYNSVLYRRSDEIIVNDSINCKMVMPP